MTTNTINSIIIVIFCCFTIANAQKDFKKGFIITNDFDTIPGMIMDRKDSNFAKLYKKIRFKTAVFSKKYSPKQINGYCIQNDCFESMWLDKKSSFFKETYISKPHNEQKTFLKLVV